MFIEGGAAMIILTPLLLPAVKPESWRKPSSLRHYRDRQYYDWWCDATVRFADMSDIEFTVCSILNAYGHDFVKEVVPLLLALLSVLMLLSRLSRKFGDVFTEFALTLPR